jgi:hypothetical protein
VAILVFKYANLNYLNKSLSADAIPLHILSLYSKSQAYPLRVYTNPSIFKTSPKTNLCYFFYSISSISFLKVLLEQK